MLFEGGMKFVKEIYDMYQKDVFQILPNFMLYWSATLKYLSSEEILTKCTLYKWKKVSNCHGSQVWTQHSSPFTQREDMYEKSSLMNEIVENSTEPVWTYAGHPAAHM